MCVKCFVNSNKSHTFAPAIENDALLAQLVEQLTLNQWVQGSNALTVFWIGESIGRKKRIRSPLDREDLKDFFIFCLPQKIRDAKASPFRKFNLIILKHSFFQFQAFREHDIVLDMDMFEQRIYELLQLRHHQAVSVASVLWNLKIVCNLLYM